MVTTSLDHPTLGLVKERFGGIKFMAAVYREQTSLVIPADRFHEVMAFLRDDPGCAYNFLSDVVGIDYLNYPSDPKGTSGGVGGRFGVIYNMLSFEHNRRLFVKVVLCPSRDTRGIEEDPALHLPSVCDLWPGAEWPEREVFDMYGVRFDGHPDLRRILTWESYPAHPLRKDYPLRGRGERETFRVIKRDSA